MSFTMNLSRFMKVLMVALTAIVASSACLDEGDPDAPVTRADVAADTGPIREGVSGSIVAEDGRPLGGAFVVPVGLDQEPPPIPEIAILSESNGRYTWPLRPGNYEIVVTLEGYRRATGRVTVSAGEVAVLDFTLTADDG